MWSLDEVFKQLRFCATCGSGQGSIQWLCAPCTAKLSERLVIASRNVGHGLRHHYLFEWEPGDVFMDRIVYSLKGGVLRPVYSGLAHVIAAHTQYSGSRVFYPSRRGLADHASCLAEQLARAMGLEAQPLLKRSWRKQALLNKKERKNQAFEAFTNATKALLVDDIVTSGATVEACYLALGQPKEFQAWSLFYRKSL